MRCRYVRRMIELRPLTSDDVAEHNAGEDEETVRWLSGEPGTVESTRKHFETLASNERRRAGKRGFGVWADGRLAGYVDCDPDLPDLPEPHDVNIAYAVHPWARHRGAGAEAVRLMCDYIRRNRIGDRAVARIERGNVASIALVKRLGFEHIDDVTSLDDTDRAGEPVVYGVYALKL